MSTTSDREQPERQHEAELAKRPLLALELAAELDAVALGQREAGQACLHVAHDRAEIAPS